MSNDQTFVVKNSGERELFSDEKALRSMARVGVPENLRPEALAHIKEKLRQDTPTSEVFSHILEYLKEKDVKASIKFNLKKAIFDLGPTGFPFEKYIARVFESMGYKVTVNVIMAGDCVDHEIDLLVEKNNELEIVEAKFHNQPGVKTDVHVALYTYARFLDVKEKNNIDNVWIVTNTKLTDDAIKYAKCKGINVVGWSYPEKGNLQDFVEDPSLYPITILNDLTQEEKRRLMENNIILCSDLLEIPEEKLIHGLFINHDRLQKAKESAKEIYNGNGKPTNLPKIDINQSTQQLG